MSKNKPSIWRTLRTLVVVQRFLPGALPSLNVPATATFVLIASDGSMQEIVLAKHGWFGLPW